MIPLSVKSKGLFKRRMQQRRKKWQGINFLAARIVVPESLQWWYWQEFGTLKRGEKGFASGGTAQTDDTMVFPYKGRIHITSGWAKPHEGIPPRHAVEKALYSIRASIIPKEVARAFQNKAVDNPAELHAALRRAAGRALVEIKESIKQNIPGDAREREIAALEPEEEKKVKYLSKGKLQGQDPYQVYAANARVKLRKG